MGHEGSGCKVGIGVATGADDIFIVRQDQVEIESELLLPLVTTKDIVSGEVVWQGRYLINPFDPDGSGSLIDFAEYPKAGRYFESHKKRLTARHVGKKNQTGWYRTIDRVHPELTDTPMLLIPDIKANNQTIALKESGLYPHHNLYFVTSSYWNLQALRAILRSDVARFFVFMYGVRMRLGFYRFQAQYLRRICLPSPLSISRAMVADLAKASEAGDAKMIAYLLKKMYRLTKHDMKLLRSFDEPSQAGGGEQAVEKLAVV
jgi:hypothetical protein